MESFLSKSDQLSLVEQMRETSDADACRRSQVLLKLDQGESVTALAEEFGVTRQTLYNWKQRWELSGQESLVDQPRSGRPSLWTQERVEILQELLADSPQNHGFPHVSWTAGLLQRRLKQLGQGDFSESSLRTQLHEWDYVWKRFRYTLKPDPLREKKKAHPQACQ